MAVFEIGERQARPKVHGAAAFWGWLLIMEAATCLGSLAGFDHVAQVHNQSATLPARHGEFCVHATAVLSEPDWIGQLRPASAMPAGGHEDMR
ncbi:hypothetical protein ACQI5H_23095 [Mycobacterium heidelbergense]|uniref:hypothetical protein n=1 Tax=Mycobacterium heidelbergense TaxID=53376 RepID=UPI003CE73A73